MQSIKMKYQILTLVIIVIMCSVVGIIYVYSINEVENVYEENTIESITSAKKLFLKDVVGNLILHIEQKRKDETEYYQRLTDESVKFLDMHYEIWPEQFLKMCVNFFNYEDNYKAFTVVIFDEKEDCILYDNRDILRDENLNFEQVIDLVKESFATFHLSSYGPYKIAFGVNNEVINNKIKEHIANEIHNVQFTEDIYMWVNEVIDYDGGDNYAIRRVHPNLIDTEGMYLSTNMTDIKGNFPYLTELEGVKEYGEIFFNYYFKKKNSEVISEKLTYARLYKDYNWIIAMGIHLDDMQAYIDKTNKESEKLVNDLVINIVVLILFLLTISFVFLALSEKWYYKQSNKKLEEEVNLDPLTKAFTRRIGTKDLIKAFSSYEKNGVSPAIIMFDVDDFKMINDTYGHDAGDTVLIEIVQTIKNFVRSSDKIYRWGGEEFVLVCDGLKPENVMSFCNKILFSITELKYNFCDRKCYVTISIGVSYFENGDDDYLAAIKRADIALYKSKSSGKNQVNFEL